MFARLLREAVPEPFRIGPVLIPHPTDEAVCALDGAATPRQILEALCGQEFESVWNRVRARPVTVAVKLAKDALSYYHLDGLGQGDYGHLVHMLGRYGEAAEYDLWERGDDLHDYFRGVKPWRKLINILNRLPTMGGSHFVSAQRNDPEVLDHILDAEEQAQREGRPVKRWRPKDQEWTQSDELLTKILDRLGELVAVEASHPLPKGSKPKKPPRPHPRPVRGIDLAKARRRNAYIAELEAEVTEAQARWAAQQKNN